MVVSLNIPSSFGPDQALSWIDEWRRVREAAELELVLPAGAFLAPTGIVLLASGIAWRRSKNLRTSLRRESGSDEVHRYLQGIDFYHELGVESPEEFLRHPSDGRLVPLRRITSLATARELADKMSVCLEQQLPGAGASVIRLARFVLEELGANIVQHSSFSETGFGMAQVFPKSRTFAIAFADSGIGFRASLQKNPEFTGRLEEDGDALQIALQRAVSSREPGKGNIGLGLSLLVQLSDQLAGDLRIASGTALLQRRTTAGVERVNIVKHSAGWDGAWISLEASFP
jgi:hypothetical protein